MTVAELSNLRCPTLPAGVAIRRADVFTAVDRPDRLELELVDSDIGAGRHGDAGAGRHDTQRSLEELGGGPLRPGRALEFWIGSRRLFSGRVERCGFRLDRQGGRWLSVAYTDYESRRSHLADDTYYQLTDAEIAARIAVELGLEPRVEPTREVYARVERHGDPLRFLRERARRIGFELAVTPTDLIFASDVPSRAGAPRRVDRNANLIELDVEEHGPLGRGGGLALAGDASWQPLVEFDLSGFGRAWDARYRTVRCRHYISESGYRSVVDFLEEGTDLETWKGTGKWTSATRR